MQHSGRFFKLLTLILLHLPVLVMAQGTENALKALFYALIALGIWVLLGLVILISLAKRHLSKKITVAGYVYAGLNFLFGVFFAWRDHSATYYSQNLNGELASGFLTGSFAFLIMMLLAQRKWKEESIDSSQSEGPEDLSKRKRLGRMRFWILLYLIIYIYAELNHLATIGGLGFEIPLRLYLFILLQFLVLVAAFYGFWKKTALGWTLVVFSAAWYILIGIYQLFNVLFVYPDYDNIPSTYFIRQILTMLICLSVLLLCRRPVLLESFKIDSEKSKKLFWAASGSALLLCLVNLLFNIFFTGV